MTGDSSELDEGVPEAVLAAERASARAALRRLHLPSEAGDTCSWCGEPFPCPEASAPPEPHP